MSFISTATINVKLGFSDYFMFMYQYSEAFHDSLSVTCYFGERKKKFSIMPLSPICLWKTDIFLIPFCPGLIMNLEACQEDVVKLVKAKISHSTGDSQ